MMPKKKYKVIFIPEEDYSKHETNVGKYHIMHTEDIDRAKKRLKKHSEEKEE